MKVGYRINCVGVVQGVGFRFFTKQEADALGLIGSVKNLADGSVEIYVFGDNTPVLKFLKWCHKGPKTGDVTKMEYDEIEYDLNQSEEFRIERR
jgi:acylphosphatase